MRRLEQVEASWLIVGRWSWKRDQRTLLWWCQKCFSWSWFLTVPLPFELSFIHLLTHSLKLYLFVHLFTYLSVDSFVCLLSIWLPKTETVGIFFKAKTKLSQESRIHQDSADFFFRFRMRVSFHFHQVYSIPENFQTPLKANAIIINRIHHNEKLSTNYRKIATGNGKLPKIQEISKNEPQN